MIDKIEWLGHASFRIHESPCIYIDPWRIPPNSPLADAILITHEHYDHCSLSDIERLAKPDTVIIASDGPAQLLKDDFKITRLRPWQSVNVGNANIKAVPAYTFDENHPAARQDIGFMIAMRHYDIYYAGDTRFVNELRSLRCDIAIMPVSGKEGIMTVDEAVEFVKSLRPKYVIPSHYESLEGGTRLDALRLEMALEQFAQVVRLETVV